MIFAQNLLLLQQFLHRFQQISLWFWCYKPGPDASSLGRWHILGAHFDHFAVTTTTWSQRICDLCEFWTRKDIKLSQCWVITHIQVMLSMSSFIKVSICDVMLRTKSTIVLTCSELAHVTYWLRSSGSSDRKMIKMSAQNMSSSWGWYVGAELATSKSAKLKKFVQKRF